MFTRMVHYFRRPVKRFYEKNTKFVQNSPLDNFTASPYDKGNLKPYLFSIF